MPIEIPKRPVPTQSELQQWLLDREQLAETPSEFDKASRFPVDVLDEPGHRITAWVPRTTALHRVLFEETGDNVKLDQRFTGWSAVTLVDSDV